jgi:xanthine dehydrogenase accessory factor
VSRPDLLERMGKLAGEERPFAVVTVVRTEAATSARPGDRAIFLPGGEMEGWVGGGCIRSTARREALAALEEGRPRLVRITPDTATIQSNVLTFRMTCASEGTVDLYVEPHLPRPTLAVAGDSPVAVTLAALAEPLGFVPLLVTSARELNAVAVPRPQDTWLAVATFGEFDEEAVEAGVRLGLPYVGLVASRRRAERVLAGLRARSLDEDALEVVHSPAGTPPDGDGPEEISLAIMAEVLSLRSEWRPVLAPERASSAREMTDPVCGMPVEASAAWHVLTSGGRRYYFCCLGCKRAFEKEPEKYAERTTA